MPHHDHDQVPDNAHDGDRFVCSRCGVTFEYVELDDGYSEWVDATPPG